MSDFIVKRRILEKETIKLKGKGLEHVGIPKDIRRRMLRKYFPVQPESSSSSQSPQVAPATVAPSIYESSPESTQQEPPKKRLRKSADRDISQSASAHVDFSMRASRNRRGI